MNTRLAPIVVGVDGSASSVDALRWACGIAANRRRPILAVTVGATEAEARTISRHALLQAFHGAPPPNLRVATRVGEPADALTECSRDAHLLVVGSRGSGGTALGVRASCPMVIMHHTRTPARSDTGRETVDRAP